MILNLKFHQRIDPQTISEWTLADYVPRVGETCNYINRDGETFYGEVVGVEYYKNDSTHKEHVIVNINLFEDKE